MNDTISRQAAIDKFEPWLKVQGYSEGELNMLKAVLYELRFLPSAQPERTECIPDAKAIPSQSDCVCLSERVSATFFDEEHEKWTRKTVTIADVLDSVCDEYTILPSAQPEIVRCKDCLMHGVCRFELGLGENGFCSQAERRTDESD